MKKRFLLVWGFLLPLILMAQASLDDLRYKYCNDPLCKLYKSERTSSFMKNYKRYSKSKDLPFTKKIFSIPFEKRMQLYPFCEYDTIYIATPNFHQVARLGDSTVNFQNPEHLYLKKIATDDDKAAISDILFNYYYFLNYGGVWGIAYRFSKGFFSSKEYPQIILLFCKNGKIEKYIGFEKNWRFNNFLYEDFRRLGLTEGDKYKDQLMLKYFEEYIDEPVEIYPRSPKSRGRIGSE